LEFDKLPKEYQALAFHEGGGHAVVGELLGWRVANAWIRPERGDGLVTFLDDPPSAETDLLTSLGGHAAEMVAWDGSIPNPSFDDRRDAVAALRKLGAFAAGLAEVKAVEQGLSLLLWPGPIQAAVRGAARVLAARGRMTRGEVLKALGSVDHRTRRLWRRRCRELVDRVVVDSLILEVLR
jgi:hypothetical protein